ncbi:MAG: hypothetical protein ACOYJY_06590 [Acutalibacteraceae bacterium]|jgi:hypothetical protein
MPADFERIYALLEEITPLPVDCGRVCGGACCKGGDEIRGMRLFPGEGNWLAERFPAGAFIPTADGPLLVCSGECDRHWRPVACRIFPLFPLLGEDGRIRVRTDPRAAAICPLARVEDRVRLRREFVRTVRQTGRLLTADPACRTFLREQSQQLEEWGRLTFGRDERTPIQRRKAVLR